MILVTGATGHIGNVLVRKLLARGESVRVLALPKEDCTSLEGLHLDCVWGDVLNLESLAAACQGIRLVYHLAGLISIMPGLNEQVQRVNVDWTRNMILAARQAGVRRLVYTSSIHAIARAPHGVQIDESIPYDPEHALSAYDRSKAQASLEVLRAVQEGLDAVLVCPTGVIGPQDYRRSEMGHIIFNSMRGKPQVSVDGAYDFVDVRDVAEGMILAAEKGRCGENYILSGERLSLRQLVTLTQEFTGKQSYLLQLPMKLAQALAWFAPLYYRLSKSKPLFTPYALATVASNSNISSAKAQRELGYRPRSLRETISDAVAWFKGKNNE
jgi:dihydroflavonol-4-reductase